MDNVAEISPPLLRKSGQPSRVRTYVALQEVWVYPSESAIRCLPFMELLSEVPPITSRNLQQPYLGGFACFDD